MTIASNLRDSVSIFLLPFAFDRDADLVLERLSDPHSPWVREQPDRDASEFIYFTDWARDLLFTSRYGLIAPQEISISYKGNPVDLRRIFLTILPGNIGVLALHVQGFPCGASSLTKGATTDVNCLLDFNESFRYVADLYRGHSDARKGLEVKSSFIDIENGCTEDLIDALLDPIFTGPDRGLRRIIFDERMVCFSCAFVVQQPEPEICFRFFNVDSSDMDAPHEDFVRPFLMDNTYGRWVSSGVLYGFTHYSGGCLAWGEGKGWLQNVFTDQYADLATMLYYQYARLKQYDREISCVDITEKKILADVIGSFVDFARQVWLADITNQDQGRQLFRLWRKIMESEYGVWGAVHHKMKLVREVPA